VLFLCLVLVVGLVGLVEEVSVARVVGGGKVTIPMRVRDLLGIRDGDYVRLSLVEVVKRTGKREGMERGKSGKALGRKCVA